jgi:hypothetical protein
LFAIRSAQMDAYAAVRVHALWSKVIAWATAQQMIATNDSISGLRGLIGPPDNLDEPFLLAAQELAAATSIPYATARDQVDLVDRVGECMPESWEALDRGDISLNHIKALHRVTRNCTPKVAAAVDAAAIPQAIERGWTPSQLARAARSWSSHLTRREQPSARKQRSRSRASSTSRTRTVWRLLTSSDLRR